METVCISKKRYEHLAKCERLVDMEFEENFSKKFIAEVRESEEEYKKGKYVEVGCKEARKRLFDSL